MPTERDNAFKRTGQEACGKENWRKKSSQKPRDTQSGGGGKHGHDGGPKSSHPEQNHKAINRQITRVADLGDVTKLLDVIQSNLANMNGINLATAFHRVVKLSAFENAHKVEQVKRNPVFCKLFDAIVKHVSEHSLLEAPQGCKEAPGEMPVQCMSIVAWSCTTLRLRHDRLLAQIATITATRLDELKPFELSNLIWAYTKFSLNPSELFKGLTARLLRRKPGEFKAQCLSTIAWSFATARRRNAAVFQSLAKELTARADEAKPQEISNTLWAFAKSRCADAALFEALGLAALKDGKVYSFKPQEMSNTVWAFATAGIRHQPLFAQIEALVIEKQREMVPQNVANILWAFAKLQVQPWSNLVPTLLEVSMTQLAQHKPQELSAIMWAASQMCPSNSKFFGAAMQACSQRLQDFSTNALANMLKSVSLVQFDNPRYFSRLLQECKHQMAKFEAPALCSALRGATTATSNRTLQPCLQEINECLDLLCQHIARRAAEFLPHELQDITASVRATPKWITGRLDEVIARAKADLQESAQKQKALEASQAGTRSVDSVSTTGSVREEGQTDDDDEDLAWPMLGDMSTFDDSICGMASRMSSSSSVDNTLLESQPELDKHTDGPFLAKPPGLLLSEAIHCSQPTPAKESLQGIDAEPRRVPLPSYAFPSSPAAPAPRLSRPQAPAQALVLSMQAALDDLATPLQGPAPPHQPAAPAYQARELCSVDMSALYTCDANGKAQTFDLTMWQQKENTIGNADVPLFFSYGILNMRVVLRRVPAEVSLYATDDREQNAHILRPVARIPVNSRICFAAYPYCENGNLTQWMSKRQAAGQATSAAEAAQVARCIMQAAQVLLAENPAGVSSIQPDEIFIDANENAYVREPIPGIPGRWKESLKWWSPEEAVWGYIQTTNDAWPVFFWRLGLIIYCVSSGVFTDPYPFHSGEAVLMDLMNEISHQQTSALRQACLDTFNGPSILHRLVGACLRVGGQQPPTASTAFMVLQTLTTLTKQ